MLTCVGYDAHSLLCVADGAAAQQQILLVETTLPPTAMDARRQTENHARRPRITLGDSQETTLGDRDPR